MGGRSKGCSSKGCSAFLRYTYELVRTVRRECLLFAATGEYFARAVQRGDPLGVSRAYGYRTTNPVQHTVGSFGIRCSTGCCGLTEALESVQSDYAHRTAFERTAHSVHWWLIPGLG